MKVWAVVLAVVLVGAVGVSAGNYGAGFWVGHRTFSVVTGTGSFTPGIMELGGHITWQAMEHLALRGSFAYNTGSFTQKTTINDNGIVTISEHKHSYSGYPIEVNVLPTFKVGDKLILRAGGGLSYHSYSDKYTHTSTSGTSTTYPTAKTSGFGSQFLLCTEGKISDNLGVEVQYKKDAGNFNFSWSYPSGTGETTEEKATFGGASDTYRIGVTFAF